MIRNDREYEHTVGDLDADRKRLKEMEEGCRREGLAEDAIKRLLDPERTFFVQRQEEVETYERLKAGDLGELKSLLGIGQRLIGARIAAGITQRELAERLGVKAVQVSKYEANEYHGISLQRAHRVFDALGVKLTISFERPAQSAA